MFLKGVHVGQRCKNHVNGNYYHLPLQFCLLLEIHALPQHILLFFNTFKSLISFSNKAYTKLHHSFK